MISSMTGFGSKEITIEPIGKICVDIRSSNHKFLETSLHLPEGFLSLEDKIKREVESRVKRGRVVCVVNVVGKKTAKVFVNKGLLENYIQELKKAKKEFALNGELDVNTLINLPGVLALDEDKVSASNIFPRLKSALDGALEALVHARHKEGKALYVFLKNKAVSLEKDLSIVKARYKKIAQDKCGLLKTDEERSSFLKDADINEEVERLGFHIRNFKSKLAKTGSVGKELDFIAQEMQREANTMAAKCFHASVSARVVQMKSQIEKIREQVQNIE